MTAMRDVEHDVINYRIHPVADLFPFITGKAFDEFVEDIRVNGQREPVVLDADGQLLDGRNRARACQILGLDVKETRYAGEDAEAWIISHNVHRRHLTESQRALVAARRAMLSRGGHDLTVPIGTTATLKPVSLDDVARELNVGRRSVVRASVILKSGDHELIESVASGEKSVYAAQQELPKNAVGAKNCERPALIDRPEEVAELIRQGATRTQIAKRLGVTESHVSKVVRRHGLTITADQARGKVRRHDANRVLANTAEAAEVAAISLRDLDPADLDPETCQEWLDSLTTSTTAIRMAVKKIKESFR